MSAKFKLVLWYGVAMLMLMAFTLVVIFVINDAAITGDPQGSLVAVVGDNADGLEWENGNYNWHRLDTYKHGVYTVVYDAEGNIMRGAEPSGIKVTLPFEKDHIRSFFVDGEEFYVYDMYTEVGKAGMWVRGIISGEDTSHLMHVMIVLLWAIVPALIVVAIGGGWLIAWLTFRPMERIVKTASSIYDGDDLSKRISLKRGSTEMRRLARTFDNMLDRLEKSFTTEKQFASDASHELRTPITVMLAECDRAHRKNKTTEDYEDTVRAVEEQAHHMNGLVDQLLSLTRIQLGTERYPLAEADYSVFAASVCEEFVPADDRGITFSTDIEEGIIAQLNLSLMSSCIYNLLQNAYKYGRDNGHVMLRLKRCGRMAALSVSDDGTGISAEDQPKVWDRFWQADASRGTDYGSGLGLSLVKETAELHGGSVELKSKVGEGSTFTVLIPMAG